MTPDSKPDLEHLQSELEAFEVMTAGFVGSIVRAAGLIPDDKWDWSFSERTPSAREVCEHTFAWLWCDRQQMTVPDRGLHRPTPDLPTDRASVIGLLKAEGDEWRRMVRSIRPEQMLDERETWDGETSNLRSFLFHTGQNVVYKAGQIWMLAFGLGLDGDGPYAAPWPDVMYGFENVPPWPGPRA